MTQCVTSQFSLAAHSGSIGRGGSLTPRDALSDGTGAAQEGQKKAGSEVPAFRGDLSGSRRQKSAFAQHRSGLRITAAKSAECGAFVAAVAGTVDAALQF